MFLIWQAQWINVFTQLQDTEADKELPELPCIFVVHHHPDQL